MSTQVRKQTHVSTGDTTVELLLIGAAGMVLMFALLVPVSVGLASLVLHHTWVWPVGGATGLARSIVMILQHATNPAPAYPEALRPDVASGIGWIVVYTLLAMIIIFVGLVGGVGLSMSRVPAGSIPRAKMRKLMDHGKDSIAPFADYHGVAVRPQIGDAAIVVAPQQSGKTTRLAVPRIVDSPGAVLATSTKVDLVALTVFHPSRCGEGRKAFIFDPDLIANWPEPCKWDIVRGCADPKQAIERAAGLAAANSLGDDSGGNSRFFRGACETVLRCLLHAAALKRGGNMRDVVRWARDFGDDEPYTILRNDPRAERGWVEDLRKFCRGDALETVSSTDMSLGLTLGSLSQNRILDLVCPAPGEGFDIDAFVEHNCDTLYLLSEGAGEGQSTAPLTTAFANAVIASAKRASQRRPGGRLSPVFTPVLDEAANIAPLPGMPNLLTDGGGRGINSWVFLQSWGQMRERWGRDAASTMWGGTSLKLVLGGASETDELESISRLIGDTLSLSVSRQSPAGGLLSVFEDGRGHSNSTHIEKERRIPVEEISQMKVGTGLLVYRQEVRETVSLKGWWERPDKKDFEASQRRFIEIQKSGKVAS